MKKVFFAMAMAVGLSTTSVFAQDIKTEETMETTQDTFYDDFIEIETTDLPQTVVTAVSEAFGTCVKEAYVSMNEEGLIYKLVLTSEEVEGTVVYVNEKGEPLM